MSYELLLTHLGTDATPFKPLLCSQIDYGVALLAGRERVLLALRVAGQSLDGIYGAYLLAGRQSTGFCELCALIEQGALRARLFWCRRAKP